MDFEQEPPQNLEEWKLEWFRREASSRLWSNFVFDSFYPLIFIPCYFAIYIKLTGTVVFSAIFALCLRGILIIRIRNSFEYQKVWKTYVVSGGVILLWSMYALYFSGYSFLVILLLCGIIPGLLAYFFKGRLVDIQAIYLAYSGYNVLLFFLLVAFQSFFAFFLPQLPAFCWLVYSFATAEKFLKRGDERGLMDWKWDYSISRSKSFVFMSAFCASLITDAAAGIPSESMSFFDVRFMFYAIMVCSFVEDLEFRLYTKMWNQLTKKKSGTLGRAIN